MVQWTGNDGNGQVWTLDDNGNICNKFNKCLSSYDNKGDTGNKMIQWDKKDEWGQKWEFVD